MSARDKQQDNQMDDKFREFKRRLGSVSRKPWFNVVLFNNNQPFSTKSKQEED